MKSSSTGEGSLNRKKFKKPLDNSKTSIYIDEMRTKKVATLSDTYMFGVPAIYKITDNVFSDLFLGTEQCAKLLASLN